METVQKGWFALYDKYAEGKLEREFFLNEKKIMMPIWSGWKRNLRHLSRHRKQRKTEQVVVFQEEDDLTEGMKEKLIKKVVIYPGNRVEIVWKFEEHSIKN